MNEPSHGARRAPDKPWIFRTYAGHSNARDSNALYRKNLAKGQTGLSVAFDLPTLIVIGLAIVILIYRNRETINVDEVDLLRW